MSDIFKKRFNEIHQQMEDLLKPHGKLDKMNSDLAKSGVYNKLQQKRITALADIRNSAAHGKSSEFNDQDVVDMVRDIERLLVDYI